MSTLASEATAIVDGPFSAVNPTRLIRAGLEGDLTVQFDAAPRSLRRCSTTLEVRIHT